MLTKRHVTTRDLHDITNYYLIIITTQIMKKKLLLAVALVGALSLGSCVDNNESSSVTAVRSAKAEQLKGLAALANAQAEAATTSAAADAAMKQAQAEYYKAQADYQKAQTAAQETKNEVEKAEAEAQKAEAATRLAEAQEAIKRVAIDAEASLLASKSALLTAQNSYEKALRDQNNTNAADLTNYFSDYKTASTNLINKQQDLSAAKILLAKYQAQIINDAQFRKSQIAQKNDEIADLEQNIVAANAKIEVYTKYTSADAQPAYDAANVELIDLQQASTKANTTQNAASSTLNKARTTMNGSAYVAYINDIKTTSITGISIVEVTDDKENGRPTTAEGNWCAEVVNDGKTTYIPLFTGVENDFEDLTYAPLEGMATENISYEVQNSNYDLIAGGFKAYQAAIAKNIEANQGKALKDAQTAYTAAKKALDEAQAAVDKAGKNATDAQKQALEQAKTAADQALTAQNAAEDALNDINEEVAELTELIGNIEANAAANTANVKAFNDASLAWAKAEAARIQAGNAVNEKQAEVSALYDVLSDSNSADSQIATLKQDIDNYNDQISSLKQGITELENSTDDKDLIAEQENTIADIETEISVLEKQVEITKATLESAINAGSEE